MVFIVVKHGDKKETLFNANCTVAALLDNIKLRCVCDKKMSIDLCDEKGGMCRLEENPKENGRQFVKEREHYILVRKEKSDGKIRHTSLLKGLQNTNPDLLALIEGRTLHYEASTSSLIERRASKAPDKKITHTISSKRKSRTNNRV